MENTSARPPFDPNAAEEYITNLCIEAKNARNKVFQKDNENRKDKAIEAWNRRANDERI